MADRVAGRPLEHLLGWAGFCGRRIIVTDGVFVPRRRTDHLARLAGEHLLRRWSSGFGDPVVVVELGCGSAAISAVLLDAGPDEGPRPRVELYAVDLDPAAVRCARRNIPSERGQVLLGDLYDPLPVAARGRVDVLVANVPYVPTAEIALMPSEARDHEAALALDGGPDGLTPARRVIAGALEWLSPTGQLLLETGRNQAARLVATCTAAGLTSRIDGSDELEATVLVGHREH